MCMFGLLKFNCSIELVRIIYLILENGDKAILYNLRF